MMSEIIPELQEDFADLFFEDDELQYLSDL